MTTLTVRGLDESVRGALKARAIKNGRSMEGEARVILAAAVQVEQGTDGGLGSRIRALFADAEWPGIERVQDAAPAAVPPE